METADVNQALALEFSQQIQDLYQRLLGCEPSRITYQQFGDQLAIAISGVVTRPEQILVARGKYGLAQQVRSSLDEILRPHLKALIEETTHAAVIDLLTTTHIETGHASVVALLANPPAPSTEIGSGAIAD